MFVAVTGPKLHVHFSFCLGLFCGFCYICGDVLGRSLDVLHVLVTTWSILTITAANRCKAFEASTSQLLRRLLRSCFLFWDILSFAESILAKEPSSPIPHYVMEMLPPPHICILTSPSREVHRQLHPKESLFVALPGGPFEGTNQKARLAPSPSTSPSPNTTESCMINRVESNSHT